MVDRGAIDRFLAERHIAFVGVSRDPRQFANAVYRRLRDGGRTLYAVNTAAAGADIEGDPSYARLADIQAPIGGVVVMVAGDKMVDVVRDAVECGIPRVWLHRGAGQHAPPADAVQLCRDAGVDVVDGACPLMFAEPVRGIHRAHRRLIRRRFDQPAERRVSVR